MEQRIITEIKREPFINEDGLECNRITYKIQTPRKTYISGEIKGKYRGDLMSLSDEFYNSEFYDFEIYEALVNLQEISINTPFVRAQDKKQFPREKLPELLKVHAERNGSYFELGIIEPKIYEFESNKKYHQIEDKEIFGVFTGIITGYIFDYEISFEEKEICKEIESYKTTQPPILRICESNGIKTGKKETKGDYNRYEYYCKHHNDSIWSKWEKPNVTTDPPNGGGNFFDGCFSSLFTLLAVLFFGFLLIKLFPAILFIVGFFVVIWLLNILAPFLKWVFRGLVAFFLIGLLVSFIYNFSNSSSSYIPKPKPIETEKELNPVIEPITETSIEDSEPIIPNDKLIKHFRIWNDYDGNIYEGYYTVKESDFYNSGKYKRNLGNRSNMNYDQVLFMLEENNKNGINGIYKMLDSIGNANKLNKIDFSKMVVSFVQDIPYNLVLQNDCDPSVQRDNFSRNFLLQNKGKCIGFQEFGICTPVEFLYHLKGDCDTRTLLLYSIFKHYNYDVAILSSEKYQHSILGINLPLKGQYLTHQNKKYYVWETTALGIEPGELSREMNNMNFWRVSIKTK